MPLRCKDSDFVCEYFHFITDREPLGWCAHAQLPGRYRRWVADSLFAIARRFVTLVADAHARQAKLGGDW